MLKDYPLHNCERCKSCYMEYFKEDSRCYWCCLSLRDENGETIKPQGLCPSCNPYSYRNNNYKKDGKSYAII